MIINIFLKITTKFPNEVPITGEPKESYKTPASSKYRSSTNQTTIDVVKRGWELSSAICQKTYLLVEKNA